MRLDSRVNPRAPLYVAIDRDTNTVIQGCIWADDETGEYAVHVWGHLGQHNIEVHSGRIELRLMHAREGHA